MKTALLVSTYNWPEALQLFLNTVVALQVKPDLLIIADDGSSAATRQVIKDFNDRKLIKVNHVWHEDKGFRRSSILNKAIAQTDADYIIQTDGDCLLHPQFIADHIRFSKKGVYLHGSRVNIKKASAQDALEKGSARFGILSPGLKKRLRALHLPYLTQFFGLEDELSKKIRGCNLSYWRNDFLDTNGYNENIEGWGKEDSELVLRFLNNGLKGKRLKFSAIIYHLWHREQDKSNVEVNQKLEHKTKTEKIKWVENGIDKYLVS